MASNLYWYVLFAWFVTQALKTIIDSVRVGRMSWRSFMQPGGMPSSHSALVASLVTAVGFTEGITSTLFAVTLVFALIVMYDAFGHHNLKRHTPAQVFVGTVIGIVTIVLAALNP